MALDKVKAAGLPDLTLPVAVQSTRRLPNPATPLRVVTQSNIRFVRLTAAQAEARWKELVGGVPRKAVAQGATE